jgi:hypothetical protein
VSCSEPTPFAAGFPIDDRTNPRDFIREHVHAASTLDWAVRAGYPEESPYQSWIVRDGDTTVGAFLFRSGNLLRAFGWPGITSSRDLLSRIS